MRKLGFWWLQPPCSPTWPGASSPATPSAGGSRPLGSGPRPLFSIPIYLLRAAHGVWSQERTRNTPRTPPPLASNRQIAEAVWWLWDSFFFFNNRAGTKHGRRMEAEAAQPCALFPLPRPCLGLVCGERGEWPCAPLPQPASTPTSNLIRHGRAHLAGSWEVKVARAHSGGRN
jgi:hypothetical protein